MQPNRNHVSIQEEPLDVTRQYSHDLQLYIDPPSGSVRLENLQEVCINRLRVLKLVHKIARRNKYRQWSFCRELLTEELEQHKLYDFMKLINAPGCASQTHTDIYLRRMDQISHFILRSAFAFEQTPKQWFFKQELRLFRWRSSALNIQGIQSFIRINNLCYIPISQMEKDELRTELNSVLPEGDNPDLMCFYKMPFYTVPKLLITRRVFLKGGVAYVPDKSLVSLFYTLFSKCLCSGFESSREIAAQLSDDVRFRNIFQEFPKCITVNYTDSNYGCLPLGDLDKVAHQSFPLCMKILYDTLRTQHHLKNGGRVQYCLFLKGIGLSLEDILKYWEKEFAAFSREYSYTLRHLYGTKGKMYDYPPRDCAKIIYRSSMGPRDIHGCPYQCMSPEILQDYLLKYGLTPADARTIMDVPKGNYAAACEKFFQLTHNYHSIIVTHPNLYYKKSRSVYKNLVLQLSGLNSTFQTC